MHTPTAIIIGSGVAGLAMSVRLAVKGYRVSVYETNSYPGGKLSAFKQDGFHFDAGPSLFTEPENIEALFTLAGERMEEYFQYENVPVACNYFFDNGKRVQAFTDKEALQQELADKLGENPEQVSRYLSDAQNLYQQVGSVFLDHSLHKSSTWLHKRTLTAFKAVKWPHVFGTLDSYNRKGFRSEEATQLFNRYATYNGSNPYSAPGMLSLIPHLELNKGTYYPKGGMISITNALYQLALKKGVEFHFDQPVQRIIHHEGKVRGVVVNNINFFADIVVSNADVYFTYKNLLQHQPKAKRLLRQERSSSAVIFYWGMGDSFPELGLHNIFFSKKYKDEFQYLFDKKEMMNDPTVYINITSKLEEGLAPKGNENWFVMVNAPANYGQNWEAMIQQCRVNAIEKISRILGKDIEPLIKNESVLDPISIESKTGSYMGSLYGTSSNSKLAAFFRAPNFSNYIKGLYFCGGTVHPGGGIPLCLHSAKITAELIAKDNIQPSH